MNVKHGHCPRGEWSSEYNSWVGMKARCQNPNQDTRGNYYHRGVTVCERWQVFANFFADMGIRPPGLQLDRIDNNAGYSKENCRWTTPTNNNLNQRLRKDNTSGLKGVCWKVQIQRWIVRVFINKKETLLYCGQDFFEACCVRKRWDVDYIKSSEKSWGDC